MGQTPVIMADTHVVVWLAFDPERISRRAKAAIDEARNKSDGLAISDITLLELATLAKKGRIRLDFSVESFLEEVESRFVVLPITGRACVRALALPAGYPQDPADRVIRCDSPCRGAAFADRRPRDSPVESAAHDLVVNSPVLYRLSQTRKSARQPRVTHRFLESNPHVVPWMQGDPLNC
jgi:PIN domain nuclease of toxin-antitoxin system